MPSEKPLTLRALNRATLARQMLLKREPAGAIRAIERLVAMQAQVAKPPFVGLWTRLAKFAREDLTKLIDQRKVVRGTSLRCTLHLMSARDYVELYPAIRPVLAQAMRSVLRDRAKNLDIAKLTQAARKYFDERPRTFNDLRAFLLELDPKGDERAMGYAVRTHLPLIQVPDPDAAWSYPASADFTPAESWLDEKIPDADVPAEALALRYLAAFGPATAADFQTWSGLPSQKPTFEALRKKLIVLSDDRGRELFDLPKAPRPSEEVEAPVRFLPDFDNLVLGHADRTRIVPEAHKSKIVSKNLLVAATFLVDGFVAGTWKIERKRKDATLNLKPFGKLGKAAKDALTIEGEELLAFAEADASTRAVRVNAS